MQKSRYNLAELRTELKISEEELIGYAADGELTIHVIADKWHGKKVGDEKMSVIVNGPVDLVPADILNALSADRTEVRHVKTMAGDTVKLDSPQTVMRGVHFVTAKERDRVRDALNSSSQSTADESDDTSPPYLDSDNKYYSYTLEAAIRTWMALYGDGGLKKGLADKAQIEAWLRKHYPELKQNARNQIASVVNPNKDGGNPKTKKS